MTYDEIKYYIDNFCKVLNISDYIGIIAYGSYVKRTNTTLSDLDIMIIKSNYNTQDCGSLNIDGVRIEYFIQDIKRIYELIKNEIKNNDPSHLTKFATCKIIYDTDNKVKELIDYAQKLYSTKINTSFTDREKFSIFSINNRIEDLESLLYSDSFYSVYYITLEKIRTLYSRINGIIDLPATKIEKIYTNNEYAQKYISSPIHQLPEQNFIEKYLLCLKLNNKNIMFDNLKDLYFFCFQGLDFNPNNFCLKYTKKTPFIV